MYVLNLTWLFGHKIYLYINPLVVHDMICTRLTNWSVCHAQLVPYHTVCTTTSDIPKKKKKTPTISILYYQVRYMNVGTSPDSATKTLHDTTTTGEYSGFLYRQHDAWNGKFHDLVQGFCHNCSWQNKVTMSVFVNTATYFSHACPAYMARRFWRG